MKAESSCVCECVSDLRCVGLGRLSILFLTKRRQCEGRLRSSVCTFAAEGRPQSHTQRRPKAKTDVVVDTRCASLTMAEHCVQSVLLWRFTCFFCDDRLHRHFLKKPP